VSVWFFGSALTETENAMKLPTVKSGALTLGGLVVVVLVFYFVVVPVGGFIYGVSTNSFSEGRRDVYICKVARKGNIKVWELEGFVHGQSAHVDKDGVPRGWTAVIEDEALAKKINTFRGDELVRVQYTERYIRGLDTSRYLVTEAQRLDDIIPKK
jgi:hypothetical protein